MTTSTAVTHALINRIYSKEVLPISDKALSNLHALDEIGCGAIDPLCGAKISGHA
jgi:hypothetical protein